MMLQLPFTKFKQLALQTIAASSLLGLSATAAVQASEWQLDSELSQLHFVSVKNDVVAEVHRFTDLQGQWLDSQVSIEIPVISLDTLIPIRNERMLKHLFDSDNYTVVTATATVEEAPLLRLQVGESLPLSLPLSVFIAGETEKLNATLQVTRLAENRFLATTVQPLMIDTQAFKLAEGINQLRDIAGLKRIDYSVPVTFSVQFTR
ncbi:YceI family protein [Pseudidiomarina sp. WS423]|uniref:YceI family protein n=1 Tax=Pseudidiomarina sp. WS423 TaxID=3425124 RepID=UPI003D6E111A